jgi:glycosyltransferase involved in cell wall biosynthesis
MGTTKCNILYISYNGVLEEIAFSQIIAYLRELSNEGYNFILLTFEKTSRLKEVGKAGMAKLKSELKAINIEWHWLRYHKRISLLATSFDVLLGTIYALYLVLRKKIQIIHARSIVPAAMSVVPKLLGVKFVFDTRGLLAEEYVGGGHWKEGGVKYGIVKFFEKQCLLMSDAIIVLTKRHREYLFNLDWFNNKEKRIPIEVIPCCVDLKRFKYGFSERDFIFTYLGKIGKHYMLDEMIGFLKVALEALPDARFMIITQSNREQILKVVLREGMTPSNIIIKKPSFEEIPDLLALSYAGIFFINTYKKFGSSPIKLGEFLSCGIPVIINSGIGDTEELVKKNRVGVVIDKFTDTDYRNALTGLLELKKEGEALHRRCRKTAEDYLSLQLGVKRYSKIYGCVKNV